MKSRDDRAHPADAVAARARASIGTGDMTTALALLETAVRDTPSAELWMLLGAIRGQQGRMEDCLSALAQAIALDPDCHDAYYNRAQAYMHLGKPGEAIHAYRDVLRLQPEHALTWSNLGYALAQTGAIEDANSAYRRALALRPADADTLHSLGNLLTSSNRADEAVSCYEAALRVRPGYTEARFRLAACLRKRGRNMEAMSQYQQVLAQQPEHFESLTGIAQLNKSLGNKDAAIRWFKEALRVQPDHAQTRFQLASLGELDTPAKAPEKYVRNLFDSYADSFDDSLRSQLKYRTPELLRALIDRVEARHDGDWNSVDLGCGTGLCGPLFRELCQRMVGVDLSPGMIAKARERGIYDDLEVADVLDFLDRQTIKYDLILAADVMPYLGELRPVLTSARRALRNGGLFLYSTEASSSNGTYELRTTSRYAHSENYLHALAGGCGYEEAAFERDVLRMNGPDPVHGFLIALRAV